MFYWDLGTIWISVLSTVQQPYTAGRPRGGFPGPYVLPLISNQSLSNDSLMISLVSLFSTMQIIAAVTPNSNSFLLTTPVLVRAGYVL